MAIRSGSQGVNSHKPGRKSLHPLLAFEGQSWVSLYAQLRARNVHSSTNVGPIFEQTFGLLGEQKVKYARFDKGFGGEYFYSLLEEKKISSVGKMKGTNAWQPKWLSAALESIRRRGLDH